MSGLMHMLAVAALVGLVVAAVVAWFQFTTGAERKRRRRFESREILPFEAWYARYYDDAERLPPALVRAILEMFAEELGVKRTQLRPQDRLHADLSLGSRFALDESWLQWSQELQELAADWGGPELELSPGWETLDQLIRGVIDQIPSPPPKRPADTGRSSGAHAPGNRPTLRGQRPRRYR